jgi:hypothetical protein
MHPAIERWARRRLEAKAGHPVIGEVIVSFYAEDDCWDDGWNNGGGGVELYLSAPGPVQVSIDLKGRGAEDLLDIIGEICDRQWSRSDE